ncbi:hypothetical protein H6G97_21065 [Nostoc flagelliforme FACHB-838]|uniref:Uncharacterized protein n=1 Tax=Nostoc flagelliforme FACHB-838 TaxID=2692904 RepID=A0ABR8DRD9_9NOSO|nr:hypothetical protein [Nostoc flagelliforme FACHB-838]
MAEIPASSSAINVLAALEPLKQLQNICKQNLGLRQIIKEFYPATPQVKFDTTAVLLDINTPEVHQEELHNFG